MGIELKMYRNGHNPEAQSTQDTARKREVKFACIRLGVSFSTILSAKHFFCTKTEKVLPTKNHEALGVLCFTILSVKRSVYRKSSLR